MALLDTDLLVVQRPSTQELYSLEIGDLPIPEGVTVAASAPAGVEGALWYNTSDGRLYVYVNDGGTDQWVDASPLDVTGFVKLDDEGTQQVITGGGGLSVLGGITSEFGTDTAQLGNIAPLNDWSVYPARS